MKAGEFDDKFDAGVGVSFLDGGDVVTTEMASLESSVSQKLH
jgi:hypothetical protein